MNKIYKVVAPKLFMEGEEVEICRFNKLDEAESFLISMCGEDIKMFMHHFIRTIIF